MMKHYRPFLTLAIVMGIFAVMLFSPLDIDQEMERSFQTSSKETQSSSRPSVQNLQIWPTPPIPKVSPERVKSRVYVPKIPKWPVPSSIHRDPQKSRGLLNEVVAWVIENHPKNDGLVDDIRSRRIAVVVQDVGPHPAAFTVRKNVEYRDFDGTIHMVNEMPTIIFRPSELVKFMQGGDPTALWLQISHESVHHRQYQKAQTAKELFNWGVKNRTYSKEECEVWWQREVEAHSLECEVAWQWGMHDNGAGQKCIRYIDSESFSHYLFFGFHKFHGQKAPECIADWARLAGHPHPEAFTTL